MSELKVAEGKTDRLKILPSSRHLFTSNWINGHNSAILAPINFYVPPIQMVYEEIMWHKMATDNKYYMALIAQ